MIDVDVCVRGSAHAVTRRLDRVRADAAAWTPDDVRTLLEEMLVAIARAKDPDAEATVVALRGFSWIVSPAEGGVLVHVEMAGGSASAGPFAIGEARLSGMIGQVMDGVSDSPTVH